MGKTSDQEHGETIRRPDNEHLGTHLRRIYLTTQEAKLNTMHTGCDTFKVKQETLRSRLIHTTWHRSWAWETMGVVFQERGTRKHGDDTEREGEGHMTGLGEHTWKHNTDGGATEWSTSRGTCKQDRDTTTRHRDKNTRAGSIINLAGKNMAIN